MELPAVRQNFYQSVQAGSSIQGPTPNDEQFERINRYEDRTVSHFTGTHTPPNDVLLVLSVHDKQTRQCTGSLQCSAPVSHHQTEAIDIHRDENSINFTRNSATSDPSLAGKKGR